MEAVGWAERRTADRRVLVSGFFLLVMEERESLDSSGDCGEVSPE